MNWSADFAGLPPIELPEAASWKRSPIAARTFRLPAKEHCPLGDGVAELLKAAKVGGPDAFA